MPRGVDGDDAPRVDQRHPVAEVLSLLHVVGYQQGRDAPVTHRPDQVPGVAPGLRVQPGRQLVQHRDRRPPDQGERDRQSLLLSAREVPEERPALVGQAQGRHELLRVVRVPVEGGVEQQGLCGSQLRRLGALLQLHAHPLAQHGVVHERIEAEHPDSPCVRHAEPDDALHGRRLASAVGAEQAEDLALGHRETPHIACADAKPRRSPLRPSQRLWAGSPGSSVLLQEGNRNEAIRLTLLRNAGRRPVRRRWLDVVNHFQELRHGH